MQYQDPNDPCQIEETSKCLRFLRLLWKFFRCIFSHVTLVSLVVAYCVLGAYAFEKLESGHEIQVKDSIRYVRSNVTEQIWIITETSPVLRQENWTDRVVEVLNTFEKELYNKMKKDGWDGSEEMKNIQWTFAGALFYSIIVITTIGYGHIAPKTQNGKVVTIFYAILGIPLMLLCLSNIGDVMASSFRFLYWKICCYVCTRPPKPRRRHRHGNVLVRSQSLRQPGRYASANMRSTTNSGSSSAFRRSVRVPANQKFIVDSSLPPSHLSRSASFSKNPNVTRSFRSDVNFSRYPRTRDDTIFNGEQIGRGASPTARYYLSPNTAAANIESAHSKSPGRYRAEDDPIASPRMLRAASGYHSSTSGAIATRSLDRKSRPIVSSNDIERTPVLFNKYAMDEPDAIVIGEKMTETVDRRGERWSPTTAGRRCRSVEASGNRSPAAIANNSNSARHFSETMGNRSRGRNGGRTTSIRREAPSARIMSPMGFAVHRQIYVDDLDLDYDYFPNTGSFGIEPDDPSKPVPIWLCVFLVVSYILGGAFLFAEWETWPYLDSAYFCFITLTTIGFGDLVPAHRLNAHQGIALCSLYLLFGIALLAMSFNLVQEEVINNVKSVAKRLGIIKNEDQHGGISEDDFDDELYDGDYESDEYICNDYDRSANGIYHQHERSALAHRFTQ